MSKLRDLGGKSGLFRDYFWTLVPIGTSTQALHLVITLVAPNPYESQVVELNETFQSVCVPLTAWSIVNCQHIFYFLFTIIDKMCGFQCRNVCVVHGMAGKWASAPNGGMMIKTKPS